MTVGELRAVLAGLPDDANVRPQWRPGDEPSDDAPGVVLHGFDVADGELIARVGLYWIDDIDAEAWSLLFDGDEAVIQRDAQDATRKYLREV